MNPESFSAVPVPRVARFGVMETVTSTMTAPLGPSLLLATLLLLCPHALRPSLLLAVLLLAALLVLERRVMETVTSTMPAPLGPSLLLAVLLLAVLLLAVLLVPHFLRVTCIVSALCVWIAVKRLIVTVAAHRPVKTGRWTPTGQFVTRYVLRNVYKRNMYPWSTRAVTQV